MAWAMMVNDLVSVTLIVVNVQLASSLLLRPPLMMMNWSNLSNVIAMHLEEDLIAPVYAIWLGDFETTPKQNIKKSVVVCLTDSVFETKMLI